MISKKNAHLSVMRLGKILSDFLLTSALKVFFFFSRIPPLLYIYIYIYIYVANYAEVSSPGEKSPH